MRMPAAILSRRANPNAAIPPATSAPVRVKTDMRSTLTTARARHAKAQPQGTVEAAPQGLQGLGHVSRLLGKCAPC